LWCAGRLCWIRSGHAARTVAIKTSPHGHVYVDGIARQMKWMHFFRDRFVHSTSRDAPCRVADQMASFRLSTQCLCGFVLLQSDAHGGPVCCRCVRLPWTRHKYEGPCVDMDVCVRGRALGRGWAGAYVLGFCVWPASTARTSRTSF